MRRVRNFLIIGLVLLASACADTGQVKSLPDNPENRAAASKRFMEVMPPKEMLQGWAARVAPNLPEKNRAVFVEIMNSPELENAASRICTEALVKTFTVGELNAMTSFYGSADGKSAAKKFGPYMMGIMSQIQQEVKKTMDEKQKQSGAKDQPETPGPKAAPAPKAPVAPKTAPAPKAQVAPKEPAAPMAPAAPKASPAPPAPKEAPEKK